MSTTKTDQLDELKARSHSLELEVESVEHECDGLRYDLDTERRRLDLAQAESLAAQAENLALRQAINDAQRGVIALEDLYEIAEQQRGDLILERG